MRRFQTPQCPDAHLDSHASRLRRKLNRGGDAGYVLNVWGVGYRLTALS